MYQITIDNLLVECNCEATREELIPYVMYAKDKFPYANWNKLIVNFDGDEVELGYDFVKEPFNRIRRITGYLVGNVSSWNNAKQDELNHRIKHTAHNKDKETT